MANGRKLFLVLAVFLLFGNLVIATDMSSENYSMEVGLDSGGGEVNKESSFSLKSIIGTIAGVVNSTNLRNLLGFFYGVGVPPELVDVLLSSTSGLNVTADNLTVTYNFVGNREDVNVVTDWRKDGESVAVLNMPFDIDLGTTFRDYSTYENNGTCSGSSCPTWTSDGKIGGAMVFDGTGDYVNVPYCEDVNPSIQPISFSMWVKSNAPSLNQIFASTGQIPDGNARMYLATYGGDWEMGIYTSGWGAGTTDATTNWTYITLVMNGTYAKLYVNGNFDHQKSYSSYSFNEDLDLGRHADGNYYFNGSIDEVQIYDYALTPEQIQANYQAGLANHSNEIIVSQETEKHDNWSVMLTPNANSMEGESVLSNSLYIKNTAPEITDVTINSTDGLPHQPGDNVSITSITASDDDNDKIINTTDWRLNGTSLAVLNMPFNTNESGTITDYSTNENHGTCSGSSCPTWTSDGKTGGAYEFDGVDDYVEVSNPLNQENLEQEWTVSAWVNISDTGDTQYLVRNLNNGLRLVHVTTDRALLYLNGGDNDYYIYSDSGLLTNKGWKHIAFVFRNSDGLRKIYVDGEDRSAYGPNKAFTPSGISSVFNVGDDTEGKIDEVQIYDYALTPEQIKANYQAGLANHSNEIIVSQETSKGDIYTVAVTPTDGEEDGETVISNSVQIDNQPPVVTLTYPLNENLTTTNRKPTFTWTCSDPDVGSCDGFEYEFDMKARKVSGTTLCTETLSEEITNTQFTPTTPIKCLTDYNYTYDWAVRAYDGYEWGEWDNSTFNMTSVVDIRLEEAVMNFGRLSTLTDSQNDTTDDNPSPFNIINDGNVKLNITYNATSLWLSQNPPEDSYQMKIRSSPKNWENALTSWFNINITPSITGHGVIIDKLNYSSSNNVLVDIGLNVPSDEPPGNKQSIITFIASLGEWP